MGIVVPQRLKLHSFILALIFSVMSLSAHAADRDHQIFLQAGTYAFSVTTETESNSVSGTGAWSFGYAYSFADQWKVIVNYNYLYSSGTTGDTATGIDVGTAYYPFTYSGYKYIKNGPLEIQQTQLFRPYVGIAGRQREFILVLTTNYVGYGMFFGLDYQITKDLFLNFEYRQDTYYGGTEEVTAAQTNMLFGIGYNL